jgi:methionyl-tRNA formyltransferase
MSKAHAVEKFFDGICYTFAHMDKPFSVIFCGTPEFAVPSLKVLAGDPSFDVQLVITQPDKPVGRKKELTSPPVKIAAQALEIPVLQPQKVNDELPLYLLSNPHLQPDFLVVVAYGEILSQAVLDLPHVAAVNVHGSILPRWRGASPIEHAILSGDKESGVTVQVMVQELDAGPILASAAFPIGGRDTALYLREQLSLIGAELLRQTLKKPLNPIAQSAEGATFCRKLTKEDGIVDRDKMTADEIDRRVRALNPWPGVICDVQGNKLKLLETSLDQEQRSIPIACANDTTLYLVRVQPPNKKEMFADDWRRGLR